MQCNWSNLITNIYYLESRRAKRIFLAQKYIINIIILIVNHIVKVRVASPILILLVWACVEEGCRGLGVKVSEVTGSGVPGYGQA